MQVIKYHTRGFISKSLLLYAIWKNKKLALQIFFIIQLQFHLGHLVER